MKWSLEEKDKATHACDNYMDADDIIHATPPLIDVPQVSSYEQC